MTSETTDAHQNAPVTGVPIEPVPRGRILVVDDEAGIRYAVALYLSRLGYRVEQAASIDDAVARLAESHFDVVIADATMSGARAGLDLLTNVKERTPGTDVMIMTGRIDLGVAMDAVACGASACFRKPFRFDEIRTALERSMERRRRFDPSTRRATDPAP